MLDNNKFEVSGEKKRVLLSKEQLKHFLIPFITLIQRFTQIPKSTKWDKRLTQWFTGKYVIVSAITKLSKVSWKNNLVPKKWEYKFSFQFDYHGWASIKQFTDLEERLVRHATYILTNAKKMIEDANSREHLRFFDKNSYVYWDPNIREEMGGKGMDSVMKGGRRNSEESVVNKVVKPKVNKLKPNEELDQNGESDYVEERGEESDEGGTVSKSDFRSFMNEFRDFRSDMTAQVAEIKARTDSASATSSSMKPSPVKRNDEQQPTEYSLPSNLSNDQQDPQWNDYNLRGPRFDIPEETLQIFQELYDDQGC